jgi:hypothetical protein
MLLGFFVPEVMEEYAMQAKEFELKSVSLPDFTATGARARVQGTFQMNAGRVKRKSVRDLGTFGTWIARQVRTEESELTVSLPEYGGIVLGTASIPAITVSIRNGQKTDIDFFAHLEPGDHEGIRKVADDWISGRLGQLRVQGDAGIKLRSGILSLGKQIISQSMVFGGKWTKWAYNIDPTNMFKATTETAVSRRCPSLTLRVSTCTRCPDRRREWQQMSLLSSRTAIPSTSPFHHWRSLFP